MLEINQTNHQASPCPIRNLGSEENRASQPSPPRPAEPRVSPPASRIAAALAFDHPDNVESPAPTPATPLAVKLPATPAAVAGWRRDRDCGGGLLPRAVGRHGPEHRVHRRRLCQRSLHVRGAARARAGEKGVRGRQPAREKGRPARPARQGAVPGAGRSQDGRGGNGENRPGGRPVSGARTGGARRQPTLETPARPWRMLTTRSPCLRAGNGGSAKSRRPLLLGLGPIFRRAEELLPIRAISQADYDNSGRSCWSANRRSSRRRKQSTRRGCRWDYPHSRRRATISRDVPPDLNQTFSSVRLA